MLDVNDDMDELYRRAAENYPLKTDNLDWDKIAERLPLNQSQTGDKNRLKKGRGLLLILLLLPAAMLFNHNRNTGEKANKTSEGLSKEQPPANSKATMEALPQKAKDVAFNHQKNTEKSTIRLPIVKSNDNSDIKQTSSSSTGFYSANKRNDFKDHFSYTPKILPELNEAKMKATTDTSAASATTENNADASQSLNDKNKVETKNKVPLTENIQVNTPSKRDKIKPPKAYRLYAGVTGNIDFSAVKFQSLRSPGTGFGVLTGYQLRSRLSIESGVYHQKKYYYTDGKYYDPKIPYTAPSYKLLSVDGNCSMFEVPVNIKYDFAKSGKAKWFAVAGMSSYFMKKENYDYTSESWGLVTKKNITYDNSSNTLLSVVNLSAGYQQQLGRSGIFRVEPYLKLPVKGFGWGRLPILSSGINVGYIRKIL